MGSTLRLIRTLDQFRGLRSPWNEIVARTDMNDAWMRHEWFECWIKHFANCEDLAILTSWRDGQLAAAAPMHVVREDRGGASRRVLQFLSSSISPRCNFLVADVGDAADLFEAVLQLGDWDLVETRNLEASRRSTAEWVAYLAQSDLLHRIDPGRMSPFLRTGPGWDVYWASLSRSFRTHLQRGLKRLEKATSVAVSRVDRYEPFVSIFDELVETSARSWKRAGGTDLGSRPQLQSFLLEFSGAIRDAAPVETWVLRIDGTVAAFDYYLRSGNTLSLMRTDFDVDLKYYSPGNNLRYHILSDLFARDEPWEYDMGGRAHAYKLEWAHQIRPHHTVVVSRPGLCHHTCRDATSA
jgi:CelD/BcsL family acetyltransferase involved in cellulose biosynthesis